MTKAMQVVFANAGDLPAVVGRQGEPLVVMPFINADLARRSARQLASRAGAGGQLLCIHDAGHAGFIATANDAFRRSQAPHFAYVAQDAFAGRQWLTRALETLEKRGGGLLGFNDGKWGGQLAAFGIVEREWASANYGGDLFHPGYKRHYADVELTLVAMQQRKYCFDPLSILVEIDWRKEEMSVDPDDRLAYYRRAQTAFDNMVTNPNLRRLFK